MTGAWSDPGSSRRALVISVIDGGCTSPQVDLDRVRYSAAVASGDDEVDPEAAHHSVRGEGGADLTRLGHDRRRVLALRREATCDECLTELTAQHSSCVETTTGLTAWKDPHLHARAADLAGDQLFDDSSVAELCHVGGRRAAPDVDRRPSDPGAARPGPPPVRRPRERPHRA